MLYKNYINLKKFSEINWERSEDFQPGANWDTADWFTAIMGELGEAANFAKKMRRLTDEDGFVERENYVEYDKLKGELENELADTFCYIDLLATHLDINLEKSVINKWNEVSLRKDYPMILEN
jgi:NTP pyrophosphatase (non-canonical NTP hydrolase)